MELPAIKPSRQQISFIALFSIALAGGGLRAPAVSSPLQYRSFATSTATWLTWSSGILVYSTDSRSMRSISLDAEQEADSIVDVVESDEMLWFSTTTGLFQVDLSTSTVEKIPFARKEYCGGRIGADFDYVWLACGTTLWQFDKLSREWLSYECELEGRQPTAALGVHSDGYYVYWADANGVFIFSIAEEKWDHVALHGQPLTPAAAYRSGSDGLLFVDGARIVRYIIGSRSWETLDAGAPIVDIVLEDSVVYYATSSSASRYNKTSAVTRPLDIPALTSVSCMAKRQDTLYIASERGYTTYDIVSKAGSFLEHPPQVSKGAVEKMFFSGPTLVADYTSDIGLFDTENDVWEVVRRAETRQRKRRLTWDDNGLRVRYRHPAFSELKGSAKFQANVEAYIDTVVTIDYDTIIRPSTGEIVRIDTTENSLIDVFVDPDPDVPKLDLTLHNQLTQDRYIDLNVNNYSKFRIPTKGLYYRGAPPDRLQWGRLGTNTFDIPYAHTLPAAEFEGGAAAVESKKKLETRDRKIIRSAVGAGYITGQTRFVSLSYSPSDLYRVPKDSLEQIVPGSETIWVDGEELDSTLFTVYRDVDPLYAELRLEREAAVDPTSTIRISYKVRKVPSRKDLDTVFQVIPEPHVAEIRYASLSVSPAAWISPSAGYVYLDPRPGSDNHLVNVAAPTEIRRENLFLKFEPDFTRNVEKQTNAGAVALRSRFGKRASLIADALLADSTFVSTDNLSRGYGNLMRSLDFTAGYDILRELPVRYAQHNSRSTGGTERMHKLFAGVQFENYPMLEVFAARNVTDAARPLETVQIDTVTLRRHLADSLGLDTIGLDSASVDSRLAAEFGDTILSILGDTLYPANDTTVDDTVDTEKDKIGVRLYETSSPIIEKLLHVHRFSYETMLSEYRAQSPDALRAGRGRILYGRATIAPTKSITFSGQGTYHNNPGGSSPSHQMFPVLQAQTIDAPPGVDIDGKHEWGFRRYSLVDSASLTISRSAGIVMRPGRWFSPLQWFSPRASLSQTVNAGFGTASPAPLQLVQPDEGVVGESVTRTLGVHIFPTGTILLQNENQWGKVDTLNTFKTYNDLMIHLGNNATWQTQWTFNRTLFDRHNAFSSYRRTWTPWFKTVQGATVDFTSNSDLHDYRTAVAPKLTLSFMLRELAFLRSLTNNNTATVTWYRHNGSFDEHPALSFQLYLKAVVRPNISIMTNNSLDVKEGMFDGYAGRFSLLYIF